MNKEELKKLLKDNLKVSTSTGWDGEYEQFYIQTKILFDGETISEDYVWIDGI
jgi:hypothetical protein